MVRIQPLEGLLTLIDWYFSIKKVDEVRGYFERKLTER